MQPRNYLIAVAALVALSAPLMASAGPREDAQEAYKAGDYTTALAQIRPLADAGDAEAQFYLGAMYATGDGVPKNAVEAVRWFRLAADQGYAKAQFLLGWMYDTGDGVPKNDIKAYSWHSLAAAQGFVGSKEPIDLLSRRMTREQIALAQSLAARCFESNYKDCD